MITKLFSWLSLIVTSVIVIGMSIIGFNYLFRGLWQDPFVIDSWIPLGFMVLSMLFPIIAVILNIKKSNKILTTTITVIALFSSLFLSWTIYEFFKPHPFLTGQPSPLPVMPQL